MKPEEIKVCKVKLHHADCPLKEIGEKVRGEMKRARIRPGMKIAIGVGSRGISNLSVIVRALADALKEAGAEPFIVPAMGSHGGATAEGQAQVLADYGVTPEAMGVPVKSSMEVVSLGTTEGPVRIPVWLDKNAAAADGIIAVNRVKAHTDFHGEHESGIVKMLTIGLGKQAQAVAVHRYGADGLRDYIPLISEKVIEKGKILGALAILEDGYDQTADLRYTPAEGIFELDSEFLKRSRAMMAHLPFDVVDTLIVDQMGKNISGTGMDTNVIGRLRIGGQPDGKPNCRRIVTLGLTPQSHGNALGVGLADVVTQRLADSIEWSATYANIVTSGFLERGFLPVVMPTDREAVEVALNTCCVHDPSLVRLARIRDTLRLDEIYVSGPLLEELKEKGNFELLSECVPLAFSEDGRIRNF